MAFVEPCRVSFTDVNNCEPLNEHRRVHNVLLRAVESHLLALKERDPYSAGHSRRVTRYALALAARLRLSRGAGPRLRLAARLHDIGKIAIPDAILNKRGPLTPAELARLREHPAIGERILAPIIRERSILSAIRSHHERIDGTGYPDGLKGDRIPLLARIIAIADSFDALTTDRAYRPALSAPEAIEILRAGAGKHYERTFVRAFIELSRAVP